MPSSKTYSPEPGAPEERSADGHEASSPVSAPEVRHELEAAYVDLVREHLEGWQVPPHLVDIQVRQVGLAPDGCPMFVVLLRLGHWERVPCLRLQVGLPLLEVELAKAVHASWLSELSHFAGVWLHASKALRQELLVRELNAVMHAVVHAAADEHEGHTHWFRFDSARA